MKNSPAGGAILVAENAIFTLATKMAQLGGEFIFFLETSLHFVLYRMQKNFRIPLISSEWCVTEVLS